MDENTGYLLYMDLTSDGWTAYVLDDTEQTYLKDAPIAVGNTLKQAFPLAEMPDFAPSFEWRVTSEYKVETDTYWFDDFVPDAGEDLIHPTMLQFPPS